MATTKACAGTEDKSWPGLIRGDKATTCSLPLCLSFPSFFVSPALRNGIHSIESYAHLSMIFVFYLQHQFISTIHKEVIQLTKTQNMPFLFCNNIFPIKKVKRATHEVAAAFFSGSTPLLLSLLLSNKFKSHFFHICAGTFILFCISLLYQQGRRFARFARYQLHWFCRSCLINIILPSWRKIRT